MPCAKCGTYDSPYSGGEEVHEGEGRRVAEAGECRHCHGWFDGRDNREHSEFIRKNIENEDRESLPEPRERERDTSELALGPRPEHPGSVIVKGRTPEEVKEELQELRRRHEEGRRRL